MDKKISIRELTITAMLIALSVIIPMFSYKLLILPGFFTITIASHVPIFLAMFISPFSAVCVAIGATVGFQLAGFPPEVVMRAASHIVFAIAGAIMLRNGRKILFVILVTTLLHALCETLVMYFYGIKLTALQETIPQATQLIALGIIAGLTCAHHIMDFIITLIIYKGVKPIIKS